MSVLINSKDYYDNLENIKNDGLDKLHILADFDNTLTQAYISGKRVPSLISVLRGEDGILGKECSIEDTKLFEKYHPLEIDPNISKEDKIKYMTEWWEKSFELFIRYGLTKENLKEIGKTDKVKLRDGVKEFLEFTYENKIPVIIISASGIGEKSIRYFLEYRGLMFDNIKIISNDFIWDKAGKAIDYKRPIIHSFNKSETVLKNNDSIYKLIRNRINVILIGDSLGDHHMVDGFPYKNLLSIGFLNFNVEELLESYKKIYDVIITGDDNFDFINSLLKDI